MPINKPANPAVPQRQPVPKWLIITACVLAVVLWFLFFREESRSVKQGAEHYGVNLPLSNIDLQPLTGATAPITPKDTRGKVVFLNFWGTWCDPCLNEFPHMVELWDKYRGNPNLLFLSVSSTNDDNENVAILKETTEKFLQQKSVSMPTYTDATGTTRRLVSDIVFQGNGFAYPTTLLVNPRGIISAVWTGYSAGDETQMEQEISKLLAEAEKSKVSAKGEAKSEKGSDK